MSGKLATDRPHKVIVIKAIADLGYRVTAADVANKTGISLADSNSLLNTIAAEAAGHLEVSEAGDIAYKFKNSFQSAYLATGLKAVIAGVASKVFTIAFYLLKISFGIFLTCSLMIVIFAFLTIAVLSSVLGSNKRDLNMRELVEFFNFLIIRDLIWEATNRAKQSIAKRRGIAYSAQHSSTNTLIKGNFFINCFSFLFGDGDPNIHLEEHKWQLTAQTIRENGGVVIKEQLAPYLGPALDDENSILPALARFDGRPAVTTGGNIAYIFPSLQVTSDADKQSFDSDLDAPSPPGYLAEERWKFSKLSKDAMKPVYTVAVLNLFGTWWLFFVLNRMLGLHVIWTMVLAAYASLFVIIPFARHVVQSIKNDGIKKRNIERQKAFERVNNPDAETRAKLSERLEFVPELQIRAVEVDRLAFTTDRETLEQEFDQ